MQCFVIFFFQFQRMNNFPIKQTLKSLTVKLVKTFDFPSCIFSKSWYIVGHDIEKYGYEIYVFLEEVQSYNPIKSFYIVKYRKAYIIALFALEIFFTEEEIMLKLYNLLISWDNFYTLLWVYGF